MFSIMRKNVVLLSTLCAFSLIFNDVHAAEGVTPGTISPQKLNLAAGKSVIIESANPVKRVSLASPEIADAIVVTPRQIYLSGKSPGMTNLTLWEDSRITAIYDLEISPNISGLKEKLYELLPEEKDLRVISAHDSITISGTVSSASNLSQVLAVAEPYAPGKIINLLEVGGVHQVMLEVRIAEMSRSVAKRIGVDFNIFGSGNIEVFNNRGQYSVDLSAEGASSETIFSTLISYFGEDITWTAFIDILKENGLAKILAEPTLITLSGQTANFLAGGEFPIPVPQEGGTITIDYKTFGVGLNFTPTVLNNGKINMKVAPEVSDLDFSNAVSLSGLFVPGITTRRASTVIELADGQSFAIAGLLQENIREVVSKFPILGDVPVLGAIFRSTSFKKNETELIIIATPHLVKPLDVAKQTLPTDQYIEPTDFELYLLGKTEGKGTVESMPATAPSGQGKEGGLEGDFGYIIPEN